MRFHRNAKLGLAGAGSSCVRSRPAARSERRWRPSTSPRYRSSLVEASTYKVRSFPLNQPSIALALIERPADHHGKYSATMLELEQDDRGQAHSADNRPQVLVSFSTGHQAQEPVVRPVLAALGTLPVRVLVTTRPALELDVALPANVEVRSFVPHAEVLPHIDLVVTHAGMGTVMASLAHGVPLVCLPMGRDQLDVAARVVHAGAGRRLSPKAGEAKIAAVVRDALADHTLAVNANRLARAIREDVAADRVVAELEGLAHRGDGAAARSLSALPDHPPAKNPAQVATRP